MSTQPVRTVAQRIKTLGLLLPLSVLFAVLFLSGSAIHYTSQTQFCTSCHEMDSAVQSWQTSPHGSNELGITAECKDCHIPTSMVGTLTTKIQKLKEPYVHFVKSPTEFEYSLMQPELAKRARASVQDENCLQCHNLQDIKPKNQTQTMAHSTAVGIANCASCHSTVGHSKAQKKEGEL